jgi:hypothetical protein
MRTWSWDEDPTDSGRKRVLESSAEKQGRSVEGRVFWENEEGRNGDEEGGRVTLYSRLAAVVLKL